MERRQKKSESIESRARKALTLMRRGVRQLVVG